LASGPQFTHAEPPVPQEEDDLVVMQVAPEQHPLGHDAGSQTHAPPWQSCPDPHADPIPQAHAPDVEQLSAFVESHVTQPFPSVPQLMSDAPSQVVPEQQPVGQEVALHTHAPAEHTWPAPQGKPDPQVQMPVVEHVSVFVGSHAVQATPITPHVANDDGVLHVGPEQQPDGQLVEVHPLHVPEVQVPGLHDWQAPPPLPQTVIVFPSWHTLLASQHPLGHEVELQTHVPPEQT
jgi:hypothetical protein